MQAPYNEQRASQLFRVFAAITLPPLVVGAPWFLHGDSVLWLVGLGATELLAIWLSFRVLGQYTKVKLWRALPRVPQPRQPSRDVSPTELAEFFKQIKLAEGKLSADQLVLFASSIASPATIRRRVTDRYSPGRRVLDHGVLMEFDLDYTLGQAPIVGDAATNAAERVEPAGEIRTDAAIDEHRDTETTCGQAQHEAPKPRFIAVLLPRKGHLHDNSRLVDGSGCVLSALSYREYRMLAGLTLRSLLLSATKGLPDVPEEVWTLELNYLQLLLQYGIVNSGITTQARIEAVTKDLQRIKEGLPEDRRPHIDTLIGMIKVVATQYAVVAVLPGDGPSRFAITYESTEVPGLEQARRSWRSNLQMLLGARPVCLRVSAANAITCQSYHLIVSAPEEMYFADFDIPFHEAPLDAQLSTDSRISYHRIRGRRGQHYLHLYSRVTDVPNLEALHVDTEFFEVPPGSTGKAAVSALAGLISCVAVAAVGVASGAKIDGDVAAFLLAVPGIAAVWLGFESRQSRLLEGTLASRVSLIFTFTLSLAASIVLLYQNAHEGNLRSDGKPHPIWLTIVSIAAVNAAVTVGLHWQRSRYYQSVEARPTEESSVLLRHLPSNTLTS